MARGQRIRSGDIKVEGLREVQATLRQFYSPKTEQALKDASKAAATKVASSAKSRAQALGGVAGHVAPSIRQASGIGYAGVGFGGAGYPMAGGAEFGSLRYKQFQPWRGNGPGAGYFVYPAIRADAEEIEAEYLKVFDQIINDVRGIVSAAAAGPTVNISGSGATIT